MLSYYLIHEYIPNFIRVIDSMYMIYIYIYICMHIYICLLFLYDLLWVHMLLTCSLGVYNWQLYNVFITF